LLPRGFEPSSLSRSYYAVFFDPALLLGAYLHLLVNRVTSLTRIKRLLPLRLHCADSRHTCLGTSRR
jgi:hypothetical protein